MPNHQIRVNVGYDNQTSRHKFQVGFDANEADRRKLRIESLYRDAETKWRNRWIVLGQPTTNPDEVDQRFTWSDDPVAFGYSQRLAKGETLFAVPANGDGFTPAYVGRLNNLQRSYPSLAFVPEDTAAFAESVRAGQQTLEVEIDRLKRRGIIPQPTKTITAATSTLHAEIDRYIETYLKVEYFDKVEGHISDSGGYFEKKMRQLRRLSPDLPLAQLDLTAIDLIYQTIRSRPTVEKTGKPMADTSCRKLIGEADRFFRWLDLHSKTGWELPAKFQYINRKVKTLDSDSDEAESADVFDLDQLVILAKYATPLERMFLLLGLNCAYGADQIGRAKVKEFHHDHETPTVRRIRRKRGIRGIHPLWKQTVEGVRHVLSKHPDPKPENFLLLTANGQPYWRKTGRGNRAPMIPNRWKALLDRVKKDYPEFPALPFNCLRNTSADLVRQIGGGEMAQLQLTHKHQSRDANLRRYSNPRLRKLFRIHQRIERKLKPVFEATTKPWEQPERQAKATRRKVDQILDLVAQGLSDKAIGKKLGISHMTVWRRRKANAVR